jgi:hypothetical protein
MTSYRRPQPWAPPRPDPAAPLDPARAVCGLAASLTSGWTMEELQMAARDAREAAPVPMLRDHRQDLHITGGDAVFADAGRWLRFAAVPGTGDGFPGGLLVLGDLFPPSAVLLRDMETAGQWLSLSVRGQESRPVSAPPDWPRWLKLTEISLVDRIGNQRDPDALVIGTGPGALTVWELLTGTRAIPDGLRP